MAYWGNFPKYVPVAERRAKAKKEMEKLRKKGQDIQPVVIEGRTIARSFWGKGWCEHLESFSDYDNRLPRGRTYVRNGSVCHLAIKAGRIEAMVSGSELYKITIRIEPLKKAVWAAVKDKCRGQIGSLLELLQGRLSDHVMAVVSDRKNGLFPQPGEIKLDCSCPDWADMCKHVAAVLYGVGSRLDSHPELLFVLRGVEASELIAAQAALPAAAAPGEDTLAEAGLAELFGIDLETAPAAPAQPVKRAAPATPRPGKPARGAARKTPARSNPANPEPASAATSHPARKGPLKGKKGAALPKAGPHVDRQPGPATQAGLRNLFNPASPTGAAVARLFARSGLSDVEFANALGVSVASVWRWKSQRGALRLKARTLEALTRLRDQLARR